jgi:hypothetical protein
MMNELKYLGKDMRIAGQELHQWLHEWNVSHLYHANTVTTSVSFVRQGALLSRGYCEDNGIPQTPQCSDDKDKKYGVWHSVFLDRIDIHRDLQKPNNYGPVLFVMSIDFLLDHPDHTQCRVTKSNPESWVDGQSDEDRWYEDIEDVTNSVSKSDFGKMLVIQQQSAVLEIDKHLKCILIDDPPRRARSGYSDPVELLGSLGKTDYRIMKRDCQFCGCSASYDQFSSEKFKRFFGSPADNQITS